MEREALVVGSRVAAVVPASLFGLAKASAAWDGRTVRLLDLANKNSEKRSILFILVFFLIIFTFPLSPCFSLLMSVSISTHSQVAREQGYILRVNAFEAWQSST